MSTPVHPEPAQTPELVNYLGKAWRGVDRTLT